MTRQPSPEQIRRRRERDRVNHARARARIAGRDPQDIPGPGPAPRRVYLPVAARTPGLRGAACAGQDPDLWFSDDQADKEQAKAICGGCPVRAGCHARAEANREQYGIWAGIDRADPAEVRKARAA